MRGLLINPWLRTVTEIEIQPGLEPLYAALSTSGELGDITYRQDCDCVDRFDVGKSPIGGEQLTVWIDDNGAHDIEAPAYWRFDNTHPIAGMALMLGHDGEGRTIGTTVTQALAQRTVRWLPFGPRLIPAEPMVIGYNDDVVRKALGL